MRLRPLNDVLIRLAARLAAMANTNSKTVAKKMANRVLDSSDDDEAAKENEVGSGIMITFLPDSRR